MMRRGALIALLTSMAMTSLMAHGDHGPGEPCPSALKHLAGRFVLLGSGGRDSDIYQKNFENLLKIREIAAELGYHTSPMTVRHMDASEMAAVTAHGRMPVPHALEGAAIIENARRASGILEMVTPGEVRHEQLVRDTNSANDTALVYAHVEGHNDFFRHSNLYKIRQLELIEDSADLAHTVSRLYWQYDKEEVAKFYQWLQSLQYLQDIHRGSFEDPSRFADPILDRRPQVDRDSKSGKLMAREIKGEHPNSPTLSVLQAFVENLPESAPEWQRELIKKYERVTRFTGAAFQTKTANEGWATISEEILLPYKFSSHSDLFDFGQLNSGVAYPKLDNPYWLGREAWRRVRERFNERDDIKTLTPKEQDKRFVAHAHTLIAPMSDYDFLLHALDEAWIQKMNLFLYREHEDPRKFVAVTRDPQRIIQMIAQKVANREWLIPGIALKSFNFKGSGRLQLEHRDFKGIPLSQPSAVKTLYVISQIMRRPASLETFASGLWDRNAPSLQRYPMIVTVSPQGDVTVEFPQGEPPFRNAKTHAAMLTKYLEAFRRDVQISYSQGRAEMRGDSSSQFSPESPLTHESVVNYMMHAPTASEAVTEYYDMVSRRVSAQMEEILSGKKAAKLSSDHQYLEVSAISEVPHFEYDRSASRLRQALAPKTSPDQRAQNLPVDFGSDEFQIKMETKPEPIHEDYIRDEDTELGHGDRQAGDIWDKPKPQDGEGQGQGQSKEFQEGDSQEDGTPGRDSPDGTPQPGPNSESPQGKQRIPIQDFGARLAEKLELRNLRRTGRGDLFDWEEIRTGAAQKPNGYLREDRTAENDFAKGWAIARTQGKDPRKMKFQDLLALGTKHRTPDEHIVADREIEPMPLTNAVIVFVRDGSGSMGEAEIKIVDQFAAHIEAVMKHFYKKVQIRYVMYSNDAEEVNRHDFYTRHKDGGTELTSALTKTQEILAADYPKQAWNRYVFTFSDGGDFKIEKAKQQMLDLLKEIEQFGYGHIDARGQGVDELSAEIEQLSKTDEMKDKLAFAHLQPVYETILKGLREFFKPKPKAESR